MATGGMVGVLPEPDLGDGHRPEPAPANAFATSLKSARTARPAKRFAFATALTRRRLSAPPRRMCVRQSLRRSST